MVKILIAEPDERLMKSVAACLKEENYEVRACRDGESALNALGKENFQLVLLDAAIEGAERIGATRRSRKNEKGSPVLYLASQKSELTERLGYRFGVDDYIVKPFSTDELSLRVSAVLRRARIAREKEIVLDDFRMSKEECAALLNGKELSFTVREFNILYKMLSNPRKTFTRSQLMSEFWNFDSSATSRTVDVYIAKIREKLAGCESFEIVTVHGLGYKAVLREKAVGAAE